MNTKRHEQRIKSIRKRIAKLDKQIEDFILLKSLTTVQRTYKYAERMIDVLNDRRDKWEEHLISAELA